MSFGGILKETVVVSAAAAAIALLAGGLIGDLTLGAGLAAGLLIGSLNGQALAALMTRGAPFVASTVVRLAVFSVAGMAIAAVLQTDAWAVLLGVALAQVALACIAVRQGVSAL